MYLIRTLIFTLVIFPLLQTSAVWGKSLLGGSSKNKHTLNLLKKGNDSIHPKQGDIIYYQLILKNFKDTVIFDTHKEFGMQQLTIEKPGFKNDLNEQLCFLHKGDSALIFISCDSLYGKYMPQFARPKKYMKFYITLIDFMSKSDWELKTKTEFQAQALQDSILIDKYLVQKNRKSLGTINGLRYFVNKAGIETLAKTGDTVWVNYTGRLLDGTIFDSNTDARFGHPEPFHFILGKGNVIKGWDQGLLYFSEGAEGQLYIPSGLAYGKRSSGPIPSNACLIFDISLVKVKSSVNSKK